MRGGRGAARPATRACERRAARFAIIIAAAVAGLTGAAAGHELVLSDTMRVSVVIPLLNEEGNLRELHRRLVELFRRLDSAYEILFVDDGSTDGSPQVLRELAAADGKVVVLRLSRNFGHEAATTAGMDAATGDAVVLMDADLQDPPEVIEQMVRAWQGTAAGDGGAGGNGAGGGACAGGVAITDVTPGAPTSSTRGADIVYTVRRHREGESTFKRSTSWLFYRLLRVVSDVDIPMDSGDFRLMDRKVVDALKQCREQDRFVRGLVAWTGFRCASVIYDRPPRHSGRTKYNPLKLLLLSIDAAIGFSIKPLRVATGVGFVVTLLSLALAGVVVVQKIVWGIPIQGYALLASGMFFLGGVQMLMLGVMGEYLGRVYRQAQGRPLYLVAETIGSTSAGTNGSDRAAAPHATARA